MSTAPIAVSAPATKKPSFFSRIEAFFKKAFGSSKWESTASSVLMVVGPLVQTLVTLTAGAPAGAAAGAIIGEVQNDLATAKALIDDANAGGTVGTPAKAVGLLNSVKTNLTQLLSAAEIKDPKTQTDLTVAVNTIVGELDAIIQAAPAK